MVGSRARGAPAVGDKEWGVGLTCDAETRKALRCHLQGQETMRDAGGSGKNSGQSKQPPVWERPVGSWVAGRQSQRKAVAGD